MIRLHQLLRLANNPNILLIYFSMQTQLQKEIDEHIKNTSHFDNDFQYMAVGKLTEIVEKDYQSISQNKMVEIVDVILNQLDSDEKSLQNNAIKCMAEIISKLSTNNSKRIVDRIVMRITKPGSKQAKEMADIYANGLVTIIKEVGYQCGYQLKDLVKVTVDAIYDVKEKIPNQAESVETQLHLINVVEAFIAKWPKIIDTIQFDKTRFVLYLLQNIGNSKLSKRSYLCLGALSSCLREAQFKILITENGGLISKIKSIKDYEKKKDYYYALAACLKSKNLFLANIIPDLFRFIFGEIKQIARNEEIIGDYQVFEVISKLLDCLISSLNSVVQGFPENFKQLTENLTRQVVEEHKNLIVYSPRSYIQYISEEQNEEEEDAETDSSYLVRASALEIVGLFSSINPKLCEIFIDCPDLFESLKQEKNQVRNASFNMFQNLFVGISKEEAGASDFESELPGLGLRRELSVFKEKVPPLLTQILQQIDWLLRNKRVNASTRAGCARLLRQIPRTFLYTLSNDHKLGLVDKLYEIVLFQLRKSKILEIQVILVNAIECLARYRHMKYSIESLKLLTSMISNTKNQNFLRAAFTAIACHLFQGFEGLSKNPQVLEQIADLAEKYSFEGNLEQTLRISINETVLMLINHYHAILPEQKLRNLLKIVLDKLSLETNKIHLLNGLKTLPQQFKNTNLTKEVLNQIVIYLAANLVNNKLTAIKQGAQKSILAIILILGKSFEPHVKQLLDLSSSLIDAREFPQYLIELSRLYPQSFVNIINRLLNLQGVHPDVLAAIIKANNIKLQNLIALIQANLTLENLTFCIDLLYSFGVNAEDFVKQISDSLWGCVSLRLIGLSRNDKYYDTILKYAQSNFSSKTRQNARLALGDLSAAQLKTSIPKLMKEFNSVQEQNMDMTFVSLQHCILRSDPKSYEIIEEVLIELLKMIENNRIQNESVINRVADCAARLYNINQFKGAKLLMSLSTSNSENIRYLFADSISQIEAHLFNQDLINKLIYLYTNDTLKIKLAAAKSLGYLININPVEMQKFVNDQLLNSIKASAKFDQKLVVVEVIGAKTTTDKGKPLRIQSFFLAEEIIAKKIYEGLNLVQIVRMALDIQNDFYDDVLLHRLDLIRLITQVSPRSLVQLENEFVEQLSVGGKVLKNYVKVDEDEAVKKISLNIARKIFAILSNCKKENSLILENYYLQLKEIPKFKSLISEDDE